tara:strand:+ start:32 stop:628 length:597 start_codon:yes stop_codon:yes gene_type:complete
MINFFTLILLALLILLKVILVTAIFNNISFKEENKSKILIRDFLEAILLICVIFVLVVKYLQFINVSKRAAILSGTVVAGVTLVLYVIINFKILDRYFQENFQCNTVKDLHADKIEYLTDNKIFSMTPSNVLSKCPDSNLYAHENKYPFNIGNMSDTLGHMENLIEEENPEFNSTESPNMNLLVVDLNGRDSDLKTVL